MMHSDHQRVLAAMQPPERQGAYLLDSLNQLRFEAETQQPIAPTQASTTVSTIPSCDRYQQAIAAWSAAMTPMQRSRSYSIDVVIKLAGLHGVGKKPASPQLVGNALYACGFVRQRSWTVAGRNKRYWICRKQSKD